MENFTQAWKIRMIVPTSGTLSKLFFTLVASLSVVDHCGKNIHFQQFTSISGFSLLLSLNGGFCKHCVLFG